jgi:hypothetical protein
VTIAKSAVTESAPLRVTLQPAVPEQAPFHELNTSFDPADSLRVTLVPCGKTALHVAGQLIPAGLLVTAPVPEPVIETVSVSPGVNAAESDSFPVIIKLQLLLPEQAPLHPSKK